MSLMLSQRRNGDRGGGRAFSIAILCVGLVIFSYLIINGDGVGRTTMRALEFQEHSQKLYDQTVGKLKDTVRIIGAQDSAEPRQYPILEPREIAGASKIVGPVPVGVSPEVAGYSPEMQNFVKAENTGLTLDGKPYVITGFNNYYMVTRAAWLDEGRKMTDEVFETAKKMGGNTVRVWGFVDGDEWNALQPKQGVIDEAIFRGGLDYVVSQAAKHGVRLIIVLTNYNKGYGGMSQYVKWANQTSIRSFYTDEGIKDAFKDYIHTVVNRKNTFDDVLYKDNPAILGWELANEPKDPGSPKSKDLQDWIEEMSQYVKKLDRNHLVTVGTEGFFGPSSLDHIAVNPPAQLFSPLASSPHQYDPVCEGSDFVANQSPDSIDLAVMQIFPDNWLACSQECKMDWARTWLRHHLEAAAEIGRPLLVAAFGCQKPIENRNEFIKVVHDELMHAARVGYPVAGSLAWILNSVHYPDYDGHGIYYNNKTAVSEKRPGWPLPDKAKEAEEIKLRNRKEMLECIQERTRDYVSADGHGWNDGWQQTAEIISQHSKDLQQIAVRKEVHPET